MVCSNCGCDGHSIKTCPSSRPSNTPPQTPEPDVEKMAKLRAISMKLSPNAAAIPAFSTDKDQISANSGGTTESRPSGNPQGCPWLDAIERLSSKMDSLASKEDVAKVKTAMLRQTKSMIDEAVGLLKTEVQSLRARVSGLSNSGQCLEEAQTNCEIE